MRRQGQWNHSSWHYYVSDGPDLSVSGHLQLYLLLRALQDVQLTGFISRNCRNGEEKFLAACYENIRCRPERSLVTIVNELSPCYRANHKLPVIYFYSKTNQMHNISNLFYFRTTLYMFRTVSPSVIRSLTL